MGLLEGKTALVTGGGRGIGAAIARRFAKEGASVMIASRTEVELGSVCNSITSLGFRCSYTVIDTSSEVGVEDLFLRTRKVFGSIDILVNNAAMIASVPFEEFETKLWDEIMGVNLRGYFLCSREAFRQMKAQGGTIINISSLAGIQGLEKFPGFSAYTTSKHGVIGLTEALACEGKSLGIRVNCIAPGTVNTQMLKQVAPELIAKTSPEDIAEIALFLADVSRSRTLNGTVIQTQN